MGRRLFAPGLACALVSALLCGVALGQEPAKAARDKGKATKVESAKAESSNEDSPKGKGRLTPRQINFVKKDLVPASQAGDPRGLLTLLSPQLAKLSEAHRQAMDALLAEQGEPDMGAMLTTARLQLFRAQSEGDAPESSLPEAVLILATVSRQIDDLLTAAKKSPVMADPLPKPGALLDYRDLLFEVHVQKNQLKNIGELSEFGKTIGAALPEAKRKAATAEQREVLATSFRTFDVAAAELDRDMTERSLELRLNRLDLALEILAADAGLKEKFFAAYAIGIDGEFLLAGFKVGGNSFRRPVLQNEKLVDELEAKLEQGKKLAGDLIDKGRNLFVGLHWWRRGRFGRGPEGMGLLKNLAATKSFEASVPLFMPAQSPVPTDPTKSTSQRVPDYDRRHHYAWAWEDRQFQNTLSTQSSSQELGRHSTGTSYFY